jgi:hypothetical protein
MLPTRNLQDGLASERTSVAFGCHLLLAIVDSILNRQRGIFAVGRLAQAGLTRVGPGQFAGTSFSRQCEVLMSLKIRDQDLSAAEVSFLKWQYGFEEEDDPFEISLWQTIMRAWESDNAPSMSRAKRTERLARLGCSDAYPDHVSLYIKFKSDQSDRFWRELITRAGLADRRQRKSPTPVERRRRASATA